MTTTKETGRCLELEFLSNGLNVTLTKAGREELADLRERHGQSQTWLDHDYFAELFEDFTENGWELVDPSTMGLTACRVGITPDDGKTAYWHERYQIEDAAEQLEASKLFLMLAKGE